MTLSVLFLSCYPLLSLSITNSLPFLLYHSLLSFPITLFPLQSLSLFFSHHSLLSIPIKSLLFISITYSFLPTTLSLPFLSIFCFPYNDPITVHIPPSFFVSGHPLLSPPLPIAFFFLHGSLSCFPYHKHYPFPSDDPVLFLFFFLSLFLVCITLF